MSRRERSAGSEPRSGHRPPAIAAAGIAALSFVLAACGDDGGLDVTAEAQTEADGPATDDASGESDADVATGGDAAADGAETASVQVVAAMERGVSVAREEGEAGVGANGWPPSEPSRPRA